MSFVQRQAARCDVCGHEWLPTSGVVYTHCTSGKCRSRKWNAGANPMDLAKQLLPCKMIPCVDPKNPTRSEVLEAVERKRSTHDPKACRIYKCGMCAGLKD